MFLIKAADESIDRRIAENGFGIFDGISAYDGASQGTASSSPRLPDRMI